ncbi:phosphoheptose isomerase, partial [Vibrio harveyi]
SKKRWNKIYN